MAKCLQNLYTCRLMSNFIIDPQMDVVKVIWPCPSAVTIFFKCNFCIVVPRLTRFQLTYRVARSLRDSWTSCSTTRSACTPRAQLSHALLLCNHQKQEIWFKCLPEAQLSQRELTSLENSCQLLQKCTKNASEKASSRMNLKITQSHRLRLNRIPLLDQES